MRLRNKLLCGLLCLAVNLAFAEVGCLDYSAKAVYALNPANGRVEPYVSVFDGKSERYISLKGKSFPSASVDVWEKAEALYGYQGCWKTGYRKSSFALYKCGMNHYFAHDAATNKTLAVYEKAFVFESGKILGKVKNDLFLMDLPSGKTKSLQGLNIQDFKASLLHGGLAFAAVQIDGKWGLIDDKGAIAMRPAYEDLEGVIDRVVIARDSSGWGLRELDGSLNTKNTYQDIIDFGIEGGIFKKGAKKCLVGLDGQERVCADWIVYKGGHAFYKNKNRNVFVRFSDRREIEAQNLIDLPGVYIAYEKNGAKKYRIYDRDLNPISAGTGFMDAVSFTGNQYSKLALDKGTGLIDRNGAWAIPPEFNDVFYLKGYVSLNTPSSSQIIKIDGSEKYTLSCKSERLKIAAQKNKTQTTVMLGDIKTLWRKASKGPYDSVLKKTP